MDLSPLEKIKITTFDTVQTYGRNRESIDLRLKELSKEWDIERLLEVIVASTALSGIFFAYIFSPYWLFLSVIVMAFLLLHGIQGQNPALPVFRKWGKRTYREIEQERHALKALRGDYASLQDPEEALNASMKD
ncbi:MAG: hypothetical protein NDI69_04685 [Bacteriovoracaceae bacterium]|nr:hypothetical protein [Bacteriovoracaceae bacterium]